MITEKPLRFQRLKNCGLTNLRFRKPGNSEHFLLWSPTAVSMAKFSIKLFNKINNIHSPIKYSMNLSKHRKTKQKFSDLIQTILVYKLLNISEKQTILVWYLTNVKYKHAHGKICIIWRRGSRNFSKGGRIFKKKVCRPFFWSTKLIFWAPPNHYKFLKKGQKRHF